MIIDRKSERVIATEFFNGRAHNVTMFKTSTQVNPNILILADSGYRGIQKIHANSKFPLRHKEDKARMGDEERHKYNKAISSVRMKIEHVIGRIKRFKIVAE